MLFEGRATERAERPDFSGYELRATSYSYELRAISYSYELLAISLKDPALLGSFSCS